MGTSTWNEDDSNVYRRLAPVAVPERARQLATLATLLPYSPDEAFTCVELGSGEGLLSNTVALAFPNARVIALDGSESMRSATGSRLAGFGERAEVASFDLDDNTWLGRVDEADVVVSSLAIHHLDDRAKQRLYSEIGRRSSERACLLIADLVAPATPQVTDLFAATWDESVGRAAEGVGDDSLFRLFQDTKWNHFRWPDPVDQPSRLAAQLRWLESAGFGVADCFWLEAGHAIYGGYKRIADSGIPFSDAVRAVSHVLAT
ncbi:MAG: class I SAM-dependent methyltransferase [Actinomycetota bacterium]